MEPLVRKIDHVFVPVEDPEPLFTLFTGALGLPVAWPIHDYGAFRSGGVCFGNCSVELVAGDEHLNPYFEPRIPAAVRGIAFEPARPAPWDAELEARGLGYTPVFTHEGSGAVGEGVLWHAQFLGGMLGREAVGFLCAFEAEDVPRGEAGAKLLEAAGGGALGVTGIEELFVVATDVPKTRGRWEALLAPHAPDDEGRLRAGDGPAVRIREASRDAVAGIAVRVRSLEAARDALAERGLLGVAKPTSVGLHYPATFGLDIWFVE